MILFERTVFMNEINKDTLPKRGNYMIDWEKASDLKCNVSFKYRNIEGVLMIVGYDSESRKVMLSYNGKVTPLNTSAFLRGEIGKVLGYRTGKFQLQVGHHLSSNNRDMTIINSYYETFDRPSGRGKEKWYEYMCNKCHNTGKSEEFNLINNKNGCGKCNNIATKAPWMIKFFQGGYEEASQYSCASKVKIHPICPDCSRIKTKKISIHSIYKNHSIGCSCRDGISYAEKLMFAFLEQLEVDFSRQHIIIYLQKIYRYDFYFVLNNKKYIIEMDGCLGHGKRTYKNSKISSKESAEIDRKKDCIAKMNNINLIRITFNVSDLDTIKNKILENSVLKRVLDLSHINWNKCDSFARSNLIKEVCEYKNNNPNILNKEIAQRYRLNTITVKKYLIKGQEFNWCNYDEHRERSIAAGKKVGIFKDGILLGTFNSYTELEEKSAELFGVKLSKKVIGQACLGKKEEYEGYTFKNI